MLALYFFKHKKRRNWGTVFESQTLNWSLEQKAALSSSSLKFKYQVTKHWTFSVCMCVQFVHTPYETPRHKIRICVAHKLASCHPAHAYQKQGKLPGVWAPPRLLQISALGHNHEPRDGGWPLRAWGWRTEREGQWWCCEAERSEVDPSILLTARRDMWCSRENFGVFGEN